jgi:arginyl-tRNA synthetase
VGDMHLIIEERVREVTGKLLGAEFHAIDPLVRPAAEDRFGDYQADLAMGLAKQLGRSPRDIAQPIAEQLSQDPIFECVSVAGPGFINFRLSQATLGDLAQDLLSDERLGVALVDPPRTIVVDYSSPNIAKEMHVGHLRSTVIGDSLVRVLRFLGHTLISQNHVGDWGTQFGMLIQHMLDTGARAGGEYRVDDLNVLYQAAKRRFDEDGRFAEAARERVVKLQEGETETRALWRKLVAESVRHFAEIYERLEIPLTPQDIRGESSYNADLPAVIAELEQLGLAYKSQGALVIYPPGFKDRQGKPLPMIVRKADGGYLYATTDLAAARYRVNVLGADRLIYVTDARQKDHFAMLFAVLRETGWAPEDVMLNHIAFGSVLGKDRKPFKTREGGTIRLVDLIDEAERRAAGILREKDPDLTLEEREKIAHVLGIGALKYADLCNDRIKDYVFDWDRMLAMDGNTAPYLQNAYVRICSIFRRAGLDADAYISEHIRVQDPLERRLLLCLLRFPRTVGLVAERLEPHLLGNYLYELAGEFHHFYERCPVLGAEHELLRKQRLALCQLAARTLRRGLELLGIGVVERM